RFDVWVQSAASAPFEPEAGRLIDATEGVREAQPWLQNQVRFDDGDAQVWGLPVRPLMDMRVSDGRWYTDDEMASRAPVAVLGPTLAKTAGVAVGDEIRINTGSGPATLEVIGISGNQAEN